EPNPISGKEYDLHNYWRDPFHYADGGSRNLPPNKRESVSWKINGATISDSVSTYFVPSDTGIYLIEMTASDSAGNVQTKRMELPVFDIRFQFNLGQGNSQRRVIIYPEGNINEFNASLDGHVGHKTCSYFVEFEYPNVEIKDPCLFHYGAPCINQVQFTVQSGQNSPPAPITPFQKGTMPFHLDTINTYRI